jgi:hypothetical protein
LYLNDFPVCRNAVADIGVNGNLGSAAFPAVADFERVMKGAFLVHSFKIAESD